MENALGHHPGALPPSDVLPGGEDKDISLLFRLRKHSEPDGIEKENANLEKIPCWCLTPMQDSTIYTTAPIFPLVAHNNQSCHHGQLYIDGATPGFVISLYENF